MIILRLIYKMFHKFWGSSGTASDGIDSHRWESKVEILRSLSS
jgi:hypothetical protein